MKKVPSEPLAAVTGFKIALPTAVLLFLLIIAQILAVPVAQAAPGDFLFLWGSQQQFHVPMGMALDAKGDLYVTDQDRVQVFNSSGARIRKWGNSGSGDGQLSGPRGIAVDDTGRVYVADTGNKRVQVFDASGNFLGKWQDEAWSSDGPTAVASDGKGRVYVAAAGHWDAASSSFVGCSVKVYDREGNFVRNLGTIGTGADQYTWARGLATDTNGNVYLLDGGMHEKVLEYTAAGDLIRTVLDGRVVGVVGFTVDRAGTLYLSGGISGYYSVQIFDSEGNYIQELRYLEPHDTPESPYWDPVAIAVDGKRTIYTLDPMVGIRAFDSGGTLLDQWWRYGTGAGQLNRPTGLAIDGGGNVYESNGENKDAALQDSSVRTFSSGGAPIRKVSSQFCQPAGITVDGGGNEYVVETTHNSAWNLCEPTFVAMAFDSTGKAVRQWGDPRAEQGDPFTGQFGIAVDKSGNFLITDFRYGRVKVYDGSGSLVKTFGSVGTGDGQFFRAANTADLATYGTGPEGIAVDADGNIFVVDTGNSRVQVFDSAYNFVRKWGGPGTDDGQFTRPSAIAVDGTGHVFVADSGNNKIQVFDSSGTFLTKWGGPGDDRGQFNNPQGVALDKSGTRVYVADTDNHRIQVFEGYAPVARFSLTGTVRQGGESGPAISGATVTVAGKTATTGSTGSFTIAELPSGSYSLAVAREGYFSKTAECAVTGNRSDFVIYLNEAYSMSGVVREVGQTGPVVAGATVRVAGKLAVTDSSGSFSVFDLSPGSYTVAVAKATYLGKSVSYVVDKNSSDLVVYITPTYSVSGTLHLASEAGPALPGATVKIADQTVTTDNNGHFKISGLLSGSYALTISKPNYASKVLEGYVVNSNSNLVVFLTPIKTFTMSGTVREFSDLGPLLEGAKVEVAGGSAVTGSAGTFTISGIPCDQYILKVTRTGYLDARLTDYLCSDTSGVAVYLSPTTSYAIGGRVHSGSETGSIVVGATVRLYGRTSVTNYYGFFGFTGVPPGTYQVTVTKEGFQQATFTERIVDKNVYGVELAVVPGKCTFSGTVRASRGVPVVGAVVQVGDFSTVSDSNGAFQFSDIPAGTYTLNITKPGFLIWTSTLYLPVTAGSGRDYYLSQKYFVLSGTVYDGSEHGPPLAGVRVAVGGGVVYSGENGAFSISGVPGGDNNVVLSKVGYQTKAVSYLADSDRSDVPFYLNPLAHTISGTVRVGSATGPPLQGAIVEIGGRTALTGSTGAFSIPDVPDGALNLSISKSGYVTRTASYILNRDLTGLSFYLYPGYSVSGTVRQSSSTGPVLTDARVEIGGRSATTGGDGTFSIADLPAGSYAVSVSKAGYRTKSVAGLIVGSNRIGLVFYLTPVFSVSGIVHDGTETGPALSGATVVIAGKSAATSGTGSFSVGEIPVGKYPLTIWKQGYLTKTVTGFLVDTDRSGLEFYLAPSFSLRGVVRRDSATGAPLPGATVTIAGKTTVTSSTGSFSISGIPAGSCTVTISRPGFVGKTITGYLVTGNKTAEMFYLVPL